MPSLINSPSPVKMFTTVDGRTIHLEKQTAYFIAFFRDAYCPFCHYRVAELTREYEALSELGLEVIAVFDAPAEQVKQFITKKERPFPVVADANGDLYEAFQVPKQPEKLAYILPNIMQMFKGLLSVGLAGAKSNSEVLPADFLIDVEGNVAYTHYSDNYSERLPLNKVFDFAREQRKIMG